MRVANPHNDLEIYTFRVKDYPLTAPKIWDMAQFIGEVFGNSRLACPFSLSLIYKVMDAKDVIKGGETQAFNAEVRARDEAVITFSELDSQMWRDILSNKEAGERIFNYQLSNSNYLSSLRVKPTYRKLDQYFYLKDEMAN